MSAGVERLQDGKSSWNGLSLPAEAGKPESKSQEGVTLSTLSEVIKLYSRVAWTAMCLRSKSQMYKLNYRTKGLLYHFPEGSFA